MYYQYCNSARNSVRRRALVFFQSLSSLGLNTTQCGSGQNFDFEQQPGLKRYLLSQRWTAEDDITYLLQRLNNKNGKIGGIGFKTDQLYDQLAIAGLAFNNNRATYLS